MTIFSERLKNCREELKKQNPQYTQGFVAQKIGVARTTYTAYENGTKSPPIETVELIADYFDVSTDYLLGRTKLKYRFNPDHEYTDLDDFLNDPILRDFAEKHLKGKTPEEIENIEKMFELIKKL